MRLTRALAELAPKVDYLVSIPCKCSRASARQLKPRGRSVSARLRAAGKWTRSGLAVGEKPSRSRSVSSGVWSALQVII